MIAEPDEIRAWVEATRPTDWYGMCAGLTDRVVAAFTGGARQWYDSATDARNASGWLNPDPTTCPAGGIHYWAYTGTAWDGSKGNWGHVTIDIDGGGTDTLSATGYAHEPWGVNAGLISVAAQSARPGMTYLGWARTYGEAAPLIIGTADAAAEKATPFIPPQEEDMTSIKMHHLVLTDGINQAYIVETATGFYIPGDDYRAALVKAYEIDLESLPHLNEYDWNAVTDAKAQSLAGYATAQAAPGADAAQIAAAVEARLRDEFNAIPSAVVDEQAKRLTK